MNDRPANNPSQLIMAGHGSPNSEAIHSSGPLGFLHPTARYHPLSATSKRPQEQPPPTSDLDQPPEPRLPNQSHTVTTPAQPTTTEDGSSGGQEQIYHLWRSRDNRKGRHRALVTGQGAKGQDGNKRKTQLVKKTGYGLTRLVTRFPVWDISYLVAVAFVLG